jgi:hypothetical protein
MWRVYFYSKLFQSYITTNAMTITEAQKFASETNGTIQNY